MRARIEKAVGGDEIDARMPRAAGQQGLQQASGGAFADSYRAGDCEDERPARGRTCGRDAGGDPSYEWKIDFLDLGKRGRLIRVAQLCKDRLVERQRPAAPQPRPGGTIMAAVAVRREIDGVTGISQPDRNGCR